jgi:hypothetical protein
VNGGEVHEEFFCGARADRGHGLFGWWMGPSLWADYNLRGQTLEAAQDAEITKARCRTKLFVVSFCEVAYKDQAGEHDFAYLIFGMNSDEQIAMLRAKESPQLMTTSLGMSYFNDRVISFAVLELILILSAFALIAKLIRGGSDEEAASAV